MKINIFSYGFWPEHFLINELAQDLSAKGHKIHVLTGLPNYPQGEFFPGYSFWKGPFKQVQGEVGIYRYRVVARKKGFVRLILNYLSHGLGALGSLWRLPAADWAFVFATSPITTAIPAIFWARMRGAKVCIWLQDLWPDSVAAVGAISRQSWLFSLLGAVVRWIYQRTDLILIQSPGFNHNLKQYGFQGASAVVTNWAPETNLDQAQSPAWLEPLPPLFTVTFAGNVGKAQAMDTILDATKLMRNLPWQLLIVGDGSELKRMKMRVQSENIKNVYFFDRRPVEDMPGLFKRSDALLVSLARDPIFAQTIPAKVQAYLAAGRPLIGSLDGMGREVIEAAKAGVTAAAEDAEGLALALTRMIEFSMDERQRLGANARRHYLENYQKDHILGQILNHLNSHHLELSRERNRK